MPIEPGLRLRLRDQPSIRGITTGNVRRTGTYDYYQLELGPNNREYFRSTQLEPDTGAEDPIFLFSDGRFGSPDDLRRLLVLHRMSGNLTNVLYSMENANTEFMPHQYKPVLKFIGSAGGRLLIADEVGLGKTIEALYIWQELQARVGAKRLLIVCPSTLREKWKADLSRRFSIDDAEIMDARQLLDAVEPVLRGQSHRQLIAITSLEGIRVRETDADVASTSPRARLAGMLLDRFDSSGTPVFDMVVVDEAHYLRNASTASHQMVAILRDVASHLLLLSATPLQTSELNLFNLLRLMAPEHFTDQEVFQTLFDSNVHLVRAVNAILYSGDQTSALAHLDAALEEQSFAGDKILQDARKVIAESGLADLELRVRLGRAIEKLSLFDQYYTRSRKRDVFTERVVREAVPVEVIYSDYEQMVYNTISERIRGTARNATTTSIFKLIAMQRQLASSMYASLKKWRIQEMADDDESWEDLGLLGDDDDPVPANNGKVVSNDFDLAYLRANDSKYSGLLKSIQTIQNSNPSEKIIIFTYYRATIKYLTSRLEAGGIRVASLMGGMGDEKWKRIRDFESPSGPPVLVSSEVGSEGIDLQFCRYLFNYDLPWNPMRLEQRIGRLDRIGQKHKKIMIYNLYCSNTIEDRVVMRLYKRIEIFKDSIGDLESIMGEYIQKVSEILINPELTDVQREIQFHQTEQALIEQRQRMNDLEEESVDLIRHGDFVLGAIRQAHGMGRWVGPEDMLVMVKDFFTIRYPQTKLESGSLPHSLALELSAEARASFLRFLERTTPGRSSPFLSTGRLVLCLFDRKIDPGRSMMVWEHIYPGHPLLRWIEHEYSLDAKGLHPASAIAVDHETGFPESGNYAYFVQLWLVDGIQKNQEHRFFLQSLTDGSIITGETAELVMNAAATRGSTWHEWQSDLSDSSTEVSLDQLIEKALEEYQAYTDYASLENTTLCERQERYLAMSYERRRIATQATIDNMTEQGKTRPLPMWHAKLRRMGNEYQDQLQRLTMKQELTHTFKDVSSGLIKIK
ncbi:MAG: SNF2-related protein [Clostridia bacterium]|jgi:superfamily II DNA or RNA helicase